MTMTVSQVLEALRSTTFKKEKESILMSCADNEGVKQAFQVAYSKSLNFFVRKFSVDLLHHQGKNTLSYCIDQLVANIAGRKYTGDEAKAYMVQLVQLCDEPEALLCVINRDMDCGVQATTVNKVWKNLITEPPYQQYSLFNEKLLREFKFPAFSQEKMDGLYADIMVWPDQIIYRSRSGKELNFRTNEDLENFLMKRSEDLGPFVLNGEGLVRDDSYPNGVQPREIGNGYLNQDPSEIDRDRVRLVVWDFIPMDDYIARKSKVSYQQRLEKASALVKEANDQEHFAETECVVVNNLTAAIEHFILKRKQKKEGTMLKEFDLPWGDNKTKRGIKLKNEFDVDLIVVGTLPHKKNPDLIGALVCQTSDGLLEVGVGSGLTDALRKKPKDFFIGRVVTVKANDITSSDSKDLQSLFLPRLFDKFVEIRYDKTKANSLKEVIDQSNSLLDLLRRIAKEVDGE